MTISEIEPRTSQKIALAVLTTELIWSMLGLSWQSQVKGGTYIVT